MLKYILRRVLLMIPVLLGITIIYFGIINAAPGGPIEQKIQQLRFGGVGADGASAAGNSGSNKENAVSEEVIEALKKQYGFDKPWYVRYGLWLKNIASMDFGESFTYEEPALDVVTSKFPVSIQFGIASLILSYLICIPLGILKAIKNGTGFDLFTSVTLSIMYAIPGFMLGIVLIVFFAGGSFYEWFPVGELYSDGYDSMTFMEQVIDRLHHFVLPLISYMISSFTVLTLLMKNSLLEEIKKDYIRTARAKGLSERVVYLKHALRNALIPIATGIGSFIGVFLAGSLLIETIFQLDGLGLLGYQSLLSRDYNVLMCLMFFSSIVMLVGNLISDICYVLVDPRIDFS
ncbi:ABC transporter permease subunit [Halobacteriovorax sp. HLS]|uniref:ABC transporter permease subunit n=1 Tax=Halobacteriovorax sp. HLS TaxID=2234000 RepID=UPI000FDB937F|nr:ABC transporter permease subunit [Halobacteriovorax sp. HLS]